MMWVLDRQQTTTAGAHWAVPVGAHELLPHFRRIAVTVSAARDPSPLTLALIEAAVECGIERMQPSTGSSWKASASFRCRSATDGAVVLQTPTCDPLVGDGTWTVMTQAHATRILLDSGRATGVAYLSNGHEERAAARSVK